MSYHIISYHTILSVVHVVYDVIHFLFALFTCFSPFIFGVNDYFATYICTLCAQFRYSVDCSLKWRCWNFFYLFCCVCVQCVYLVYGICVVGQFTAIFTMAVKNCSPLLCIKHAYFIQNLKNMTSHGFMSL